MIILILILFLLAFLQTTILPLNLVLIVLVLRAYERSGKENLYLAFGMGMLMSHLEIAPLGILSIVYLVSVIFAQMLSLSRLSNHFLSVIPLTLIVLSSSSIVTSLFLHQSFQIWPKVLLESLIALPAYIIIKFWEERFVVKDIKLRL